MTFRHQGEVTSKARLLFLLPLVYRPEKVNIAGQFRQLSRWYEGHIFALSGGRQTNVSVGGFLFHAEPFGSGATGRFFRGLRAQVIRPLRMFWRKSRIDAIVAYDPYRSGFAALMLKRMLRCKFIVELNGDYHREEPGSNAAARFVMRQLFSIVVRGADAIKVLNADQEAFCRRLAPRTPVFRFPAYVATEYFGSLEASQGDYLLSIGYPFDLKGMDVLIAAFKMIADKHPRYSLRIMGWCSQWDREKYRALANGHPRITFLEPGWVEDVGEQMRGCYALVNAARTEAMGRVHVEAMACAKPIVATRTNGGLECVQEGSTGLLCEIGNAVDLAAKLDDLLSSPSRAARMGEAGKERAAGRFSEAAYAHSSLEMLRNVIGSDAGA